jgi:hypothetical protein
MTRDVRLIVSEADRPVLFDLLVEASDKLAKDGIVLKGRAGRTGRFASGSAEIAEIILAIGSAGGFTVLAAILREYFKQRPNGVIEIEQTVRKGSKKTTITASGAKAEDIAKSLSVVLR